MRFALLLLAFALASGCAAPSVRVQPDPSAAAEAPTPARQLADEGRHAEAARAYAGMAQAARGRERDALWLRAADQHALAADLPGQRAALAQSSRRRLESTNDLLLHDLLSAQLRAADGDAAGALALLAQRREAVPASLAPRWHARLAELLRAAGRGFEAAGELAWLASLQTGRARADSVRAIEALVGAESDASLSAQAAALPVGHPLYAYAGRALVQRGLPLPRPFDRSGAAPGFGSFAAADADGYRPPERLAVLLPLSGPLAAAGQSVRDGLLAGYYGETRRRPQVRFYDTGGNDEGALRAAGEALADGAHMIIGPLTRGSVDALFGMPALDVPVLALNRGQLPPPPGSAAFALSPEEEGMAAADRLLARGFRRILVVTQADDAAQRALAAFRERLQARGGSVTGEVRVADGQPDYVPALQQAIAGGRPDALFLTLKAGPARLLASQLEPAGLEGIARVATSLVLSGGNLRMDVELDGIEYPELPWLIGLRSDLPDADTLGRGLPSAQGGGGRLFAFGLDAWRLAAYLDALQRDPALQVRGATGELQLDPLGIVQRAPAWAVFSGGRARPALDGALLPDAVTR